MGELMNMKEAAKYAGLSYKHFLNTISHPKCDLKLCRLPGGKRPLIRRKDLDEFIKQLQEY